mgnify:CR=1 FL=1
MIAMDNAQALFVFVHLGLAGHRHEGGREVEPADVVTHTRRDDVDAGKLGFYDVYPLATAVARGRDARV